MADDRDYSEKRRFERFDFIQATYFKSKDGESGIEECYLNNISTGGMSFDIKDQQIKLGDEVIIMYKIGSHLRRDILCVKHIERVFNNWRCGSEFIDDDPERYEMIRRFIDKLNKRW